MRQASPIDVRISWGKTFRETLTAEQRFEKQLERIYGAMQLSQSLQSIDLIDLSAAAIVFYDKLTMVEADKLKLEFITTDFSEQNRRGLVDHNWIVLHERHNASRLRDPLAMPISVKELLLKIQWLSFKQLPENDVGSGPDQLIKAKDELNWRVFELWMRGLKQLLLGRLSRQDFQI